VQGKYKQILFASVAHDLRTPLNTVLALNNQIMDVIEDKYQHLVRISNSSCKFLFSTLDDIFDLSKLELGHFTLSKEWFNLKISIVDELTNILGI
jgi:signal transduction histidine kinase